MNVMKLIQKLRSARQRFPRLADSTFWRHRRSIQFGVSLSWCVLRMVAAQGIESAFTQHTVWAASVAKLRSRLHNACGAVMVQQRILSNATRLQCDMHSMVWGIPMRAAPVTTSMKCSSCIELTAAHICHVSAVLLGPCK